MISRLRFTAVVLLASVSAAFGQAATPAPKPKPLSGADKVFLRNALEGVYFENQIAGRIRSPRSKGSDELKKIGTKLYGDLNKVWGDIAVLAQKRDEKVPMELNASDKRTMEKLGKVEDAKYDQEVLDLLAKSSSKLAKDFEGATKSVQDPELKAAVEKWTPTFKTHAEQIAAAEKEASKKK